MTFIAEIHDVEGRDLLDTIDEIRQLGRIPQEIDLPQIIVVGQQSSGKSSVLGAVSGIPFPTETGLCTQFATEICCRRADATRSAAKITPSKPPSPQRLEQLTAFAHRWEQATIDTVEQVKAMIDEARVAMGLQAGQGYSDDRLVVEIQGPAQEHLTIIDLPGLISSGNKAEIKQVDELVTRYMRQTNTIIVAVIHGFLDGKNQRIFDLDAEFWPRTLGVITAPDMIDWSGNGSKVIKSIISSTGQIRPRHGWHMVRNLKSEEIRKGLDRIEVENAFFADKTGSPEWKGMERVLCGIEPLRQKLSKSLKLHISSFLPLMLGVVETTISKSRAELRALGEERTSTTQQRSYLAKSAGVLNGRIRNTLEGKTDAFEVGFDGKSLRDKVRNENETFADEMINKGHTWQVESISSIEHMERKNPDYEDDAEKALKRDGTTQLEPYPVTKHALLDHLTRAISERPGRALRGTFDPVWVGTFFLQQSRKWRMLVEAHVEKVFDIVADEVRSSIYACLSHDTANALLGQIFEPNLAKRHEMLQAKIEEVLTPYTSQYPATLNRGYTTTLLRENKKHRSKSAGKEIESESEDEADLQYEAAAHICRCMESYYAVAINVLLDNVQSLGIENVLLKGLDRIFEPESLAEMGAEEIAQLAAESSDKADERIELTDSIRDYERAKTIILKQRARAFVSVSASTPPRSANSPARSSQAKKSPSPPAVLATTRPVHSAKNEIEVP